MPIDEKARQAAYTGFRRMATAFGTPLRDVDFQFEGAIDEALHEYESAKAQEREAEQVDENAEGDIEYRRNLVADLRAIHSSAFINDEVMKRQEKADMLHFIYRTCISAANELEELCEPDQVPAPLTEEREAGEVDEYRAIADKALLLAARWFKLAYEDETLPEHPPSKADLAGMFDAMQEARDALLRLGPPERQPTPLLTAIREWAAAKQQVDALPDAAFFTPDKHTFAAARKRAAEDALLRIGDSYSSPETPPNPKADI